MSLKLKVGFIGLGAMGEPMAGHLHTAGWLSVVGNRSIAKAQLLAVPVNAAHASHYFPIATSRYMLHAIPMYRKRERIGSRLESRRLS